MKLPGRKKPFKAKKLPNTPCSHCGTPAVAQWSLSPCAWGNKRRWFALCESCDLEIHSIILKFFKVRHARRYLKRYRAG